MLSDENLLKPVTLICAAVELQGSDPLLTGLWGAYVADTYTEWPFAADGNVCLYVPAENVSNNVGIYTVADIRYTI